MEDSVNTTQPVNLDLKPDLKLKGLTTSSQITSAYYSVKDAESSKENLVKEEVEKDEDSSSLSPTASDMAAPIAPIHHRPRLFSEMR